MANAYSLQNDYGNIQKPANLNLISTVLSAKQTKHDKNLAQIEQMKQEYGNINFLKEGVDQKFQQRLQTLVDDVNSSGQIDWSNNNVARKIRGHISTVLDEEMIGYMKEDQKVKAFQERMNEIQDTEEYHQNNEMFAMYKAGVNEYINGDAQKVGDFNYTPYTDVGAEISDVTNNITNYVDDIKVETIDGQTKYTRYSEELTPSEVKNIVFSQLSDRAKEQIKINGFSKYVASGNTNMLNQAYLQYSQPKLQEIDSQISKIDLNIKNVNDENTPRIQKLKDKKDELQRQKESIFKLVNSEDKNALIQKAKTVEQESILGNLGRVFSEDRDDINKIEIDTVSSSTVGNNSGKSVTEDGLPLFQELGRGYEGEQQNLLNNATTRAEENADILKGSINAIYNELPEDIKQNLDKQFKAQSDIENKADFLYKEFNRMSKESGNIIEAKKLNEVRRLKHRIDTDNNYIDKSINESLKAQEAAEAENIFEDLKSNEDFTITLSDGTTTTSGEYLKNIDSVEDFKDTDAFKNTMATMYAKKIKQETGGGLFEIVRKGVDWSNVMLAQLPVESFVDTEGLLEISKTRGKKVRHYTSRIKGLLRGDNKEETEQNIQTVLSNTELTDGNAGATIAESFMPLLKFGRDAVITTEAEVLDNLDFEDVEVKANKWLINNLPKKYQNQSIVINPGSNMHNSSRTIMAATDLGYDREGMAAVNFDSSDGNVPITLTEVSPLRVRLSMTTGKEDDEGNPIYKQRTVMKKDVPAELKKQIDLSDRGKTFTVKNYPKEVVNNRVYFPSAENTKRMRDSEAVLGGMDNALAFSKEQLKQNSFTNYKDILGTIQQPSPIGSLVNKIYEDQNFIVKTVKEDDRVYPAIGHRGSDFQYKSSVPIEENNLDTAFDKIHTTPHIFVAGYIQKMLYDLEENQDDTKLKKLLSIYEKR